MGGKNTPGVPASVTAAQTADMNQLTSLASQQGAQSTQLFNLTEPGLAQTESYFRDLASGDPYALARANAPAAQQINAAAASAAQNVMQSAPQGGEKNLALENISAQQGAQVGNLAAQGYIGAQGALGQLAGQGIGEAQSAAGLGLSGAGSAANVASTMGSQSLQAQQLQLQQKGQTLGAVGGLAGDAATLGAAGIGASGAGKAASAALLA